MLCQNFRSFGSFLAIFWAFLAIFEPFLALLIYKGTAGRALYPLSRFPSLLGNRSTDFPKILREPRGDEGLSNRIKKLKNLKKRLTPPPMALIRLK